MHVPVRLGLLCVALTVSVLSKDNERHPTEDIICHQSSPILGMSVIDDIYLEPRYYGATRIFPYGTPLSLWCSYKGVHSSRLAMMKQRQLLPTKTDDTATISFSTGKLDLQEHTEFTCAVKDHACEVSKFISVTPALDVISPNISCDDTRTNYTIQYGKSITVQCTGPTASGLILTKEGKQLPTEHVSNNTINWFERTPDLQISTYVCTDVNTGSNRSILISVTPLIYGKGIIYGNGAYKYMLKYKDGMSAAFCSGPRAVEFINVESEYKEILTESLNKTTVKLSIPSSELGKSVFACVDSTIPDYKSTLLVAVTPRMVLTSPNMRYNHDTQAHLYVAIYGNPLKIICSGPDAAQLTMGYLEKDNERKKTIERLNETSIKWSINKLELQEDEGYFCSAGEVTSATWFVNQLQNISPPQALSPKEVRSVVFVDVAPHPEAVNFQCISHHLRYLNCTWSTLSNRNNFTLSYVDNGIPVRIYTQSPSLPSSLNRFCVWYSTGYPAYTDDVATLSFIMESCNILGCFNQTFHIDHLSIVKLDPPSYIHLYETNFRALLVQWYTQPITVAGESLTLENSSFLHRVEYQYSGIEPLEANSSQAICYARYCYIRLTLPCPEQSYEVRVYEKIKRTVGEEFWSNPVSGTVYIKGKNNGKDIDPACYKPRKTKYVMMYSVQVLKEEVHLTEVQIKKKVSSLQKKLKTPTYLKHKKGKL